MGKKSRKKGRSLDDLNDREKVEIYGRAAKLRKASRNKSNGRDEWKRKMRQGNLDSEGSVERLNRQQTTDIDHWAEKALSKADEMKVWERAGEEHDLLEGIISRMSRKGGVLLHEGRELEFELKPELAMMQKSELAVGESVLFSEIKENYALVEQALPRRQILSRPDPTRKGLERVIAVNMDVIVIVSTITDPVLNTNLIDRFLIGVEQSRAKPLVCINKMDLYSEELSDEKARAEIYRQLGYDVVYCSAESGSGVDELQQQLKGKSCVFLGTSGVGKSSLLNAIEPGLQLKTQKTREKAAGRGRHTTVMATMHQLANGMRLIDTPGVREFNFLDLELSEVQYGFSEFAAHTPCKFNNCLHDKEKGCNVKAAVENGEIISARYDSYLSILRNLNIKRLPPKQRDNLLY